MGLYSPFFFAGYLPLKDLNKEKLQSKESKKIPTIFRVMFSKTLLVFYALPLIFIGIIVLRPVEKEAEKVQKIEIVQPRVQEAPAAQPGVLPNPAGSNDTLGRRDLWRDS